MQPYNEAIQAAQAILFKTNPTACFVKTALMAPKIERYDFGSV